MIYSLFLTSFKHGYTDGILRYICRKSFKEVTGYAG